MIPAVFRGLAFIALLSSGSLFGQSSVSASVAPAKVTIAFAADGLGSLKYGGTEFLTNDPMMYPRFGGTLGRVYASSGQSALPDGFTMAINGQTITQTYAWGVVQTVYQPVANRLEITQTIQNQSTVVIDAWSTVPLRLTTPQAATMDGYELQTNTDEPIVNTLNFGTGTVAFCGRLVATPTIEGFQHVDAPVNWNAKLEMGRSPENPDNQYAYDPIAPGASHVTKFALAFGGPNDTAFTLGPDVFAAFADAFPYQNSWPDRRAIGVDYIANSDDMTATNPRRYLKGTPVNVTTRKGRAAFATALLQRAETDIANLAAIHAQGIIIWDLEGAEQPQDISYIGDPRICETLAPELGTIVPGTQKKAVDAFFKKFTSAGYRVGVTIRPHRLDQNGVWVGRLKVPYNPKARITQDELGVRGLSDQATADLLIKKIRYARARWGCTMFFCDSIWLNSAHIFELVRAKIPDVLICPENSLPRHYASSAPLSHLADDPLHPGLSEDSQAIYPDAFTISYAPDANPNNDPDQAAALRTAVSAGQCLLLGRVWFDSPELARIRAAYGY